MSTLLQSSRETNLAKELILKLQFTTIVHSESRVVSDGLSGFA